MTSESKFGLDGSPLLNVIDPALLILLFLFALRGYFKGLFRETFTLAGLVVGFMIAVRYDEALAGLGSAYWKVSPLIIRAAAFIALFFVVYFFFSLVGWLLHQSEKLLFLQTINRIGGIAVGLGKGAAILAAAAFLATSSSWVPAAAKERLDDSYLVAPLSQFAEGVVRIGKRKFFPRVKSRPQERPKENLV